MDVRFELTQGLGLVEERTFRFTSEEQPYGFFNVGSKICEVVPWSHAGTLGVRPGWYIAAVDGEELLGAMPNYCRRVPAVTTEEVQKILRAKRAQVLRVGRPLELIFWTKPAMFEKPPEVVNPRYEASSAAELVSILVACYGSVISAWDTALDLDGNGKLDYGEFLSACRAVGFNGSLKRIFSELADDDGLVSITSLDPTCKMDFAQGRCAVCTLPNPCEVHSEQHQRSLTLERRRNIVERGAH